MPSAPFRFVHASDLHLERLPEGLAEAPEHLREVFLEAGYAAARRIFDTAVAEEAEMLLLAGDVLQPELTGPRGPLFLAEQFARLAERKIAVYWAGGEVDPPEVWPEAIRLPENVHTFPRGRVAEFVHQRDGVPIARVVGTSRDRTRPIPVTEFDPDPAGLFTIAVAHGAADPPAMEARRIHYWALGGRHHRGTLTPAPYTIHDAGTPQGRSPHEEGAHGCTLVDTDGQQPRTSLVPTDVMRWLSERVAIDAGATCEDLERLLGERIHAIREAAPAIDLLVSWTVTGAGSLVNQLRRGGLAAEVLDGLRKEFGHQRPAVWSVALEVELPESLPTEWYDQETIRGDYLRAVRQFQMNPAEPLGLEGYLAEPHLAGALAPAASIAAADRGRVLGEAALLGVDLLSPEEPAP